MKKIYSLPFVIMLLVVTFGSCNKDNPPQSDDPKFRLFSKTFFGEEGHIISQTNYSFAGNKISHLESEEANDRYIADYSYMSEKVTGDVEIYNDSILERESTVEYIFENDLLTRINAWGKTKNDSVITRSIEFEYSGNKLTEYVEYNISNPYSKATYEYESDKLINFTLYYFQESKWVKWYTDEIDYNGNLINEVITSMVIIDPSNFMLISKMVYHYENDLPKKIDVCSTENENWVLSYYIDHYYDQHSNLYKEEHKSIQDSALMYYYEYQYEEGGSNLKDLIYRGFSYDPRLVYPTPNGLLPKNLLKELLKDNRYQ